MSLDRFDMSLLSEPCRIQILAKRGGGAAIVCKKIIQYKNINTTVISPTDQYIKFYSQFLPSKNIHWTFDSKYLEYCTDIKHLFVLEQLASTSLYQNKDIQDIIYNGQFNNKSIIMLTQYMINTGILMDYIFMHMKSLSKLELSNLYKDHLYTYFSDISNLNDFIKNSKEDYLVISYKTKKVYIYDSKKSIHLKKFDMNTLNNSKIINIIAPNTYGKSNVCKNIIQHCKSHCTVVAPDKKEFYSEFIPESDIKLIYNNIYLKNEPNMLVLDSLVNITLTKRTALRRTLLKDATHTCSVVIAETVPTIFRYIAMCQNVEYTFFSTNSNSKIKESVHKYLGKYIEDYKLFEILCKQYDYLVFSNFPQSDKIEDRIFWYRTEPEKNTCEKSKPFQLKKFNMSLLTESNGLINIVAPSSSGKSTICKDILLIKDIQCTVISTVEQYIGLYKNLKNVTVYEDYKPEYIANNKLVILDETNFSKISNSNISDLINNNNSQIVVTEQYPRLLNYKASQNMIEYMFVSNNNSIQRKKKIYKYLNCSLLNSFDEFKNLFQSCDRYTYLVFANFVQSDKIEDCIFWYKSKTFDKIDTESIDIDLIPNETSCTEPIDNSVSCETTNYFSFPWLGTKPETVKDEPETVKDEPETVKDEPETVKDEPATIKDEPATVKDEPETIKDEPETLKDEPATIKDEPATVKDEPETIKDEPATVKDEPATVKDEPATVKDEAETVKDEAETVKDEPETVKDEWETIKEELVKDTDVTRGYFSFLWFGRSVSTAIKDDAIKDDAIKDETVKDETVKDETVKDETVKDDEIKDDALKDDAIKDDAIKDDAIKDDAIKDDAIKDETVKDETVKDDAIKDDAIKDDVIKDDVIKDETVKDDTVIDEKTSNYSYFNPFSW